jgi:hypothetical protein
VRGNSFSNCGGLYGRLLFWFAQAMILGSALDEAARIPYLMAASFDTG